MDIEQILFIQGKNLAPGIASETVDINHTKCIHQQEKHLLFKTKQHTSYCVPVMSPHTSLGVAVAESLHDEMCGASPASTMARGSRYFHYTPSPVPLFRSLADNCIKCRRIKMKKLTNHISPLRHIAQDTMLEGISLQVDIFGPYKVCTRAKQITTREMRRQKRAQIKLWVLVTLDYFTSRIEVSVLEDMTSESVTSALHEVIATQRWRNKIISLDPESSLVPAVKRTSEELGELAEHEGNPEEEEEGVEARQAAALVTDLRQEGFEIQTLGTKLSERKAKVESIIKTFK